MVAAAAVAGSNISLCEFLALKICPRLTVFGDVRFDSDLWGRDSLGSRRSLAGRLFSRVRHAFEDGSFSLRFVASTRNFNLHFAFLTYVFPFQLASCHLDLRFDVLTF